MRNSICFRIVAMLLVAMLLATISGISEELPDAGDTLNEAPASVETMEMLEVMSVEDALDEAEQEFLSEAEPEEVASDALDTSEVKDEPALAYEPEDEGKQNAEISELADNTVEPALEEAEESQLVPDLPVETSPQNEDVLFVEEDASQKLEAEAAGGLPTSITLNASTVTLGKKERFQIVPQVNDGASAVFKYTVKNKKIASVTKNGMIRGKRRTICCQRLCPIPKTIGIQMVISSCKLPLLTKACSLRRSRSGSRAHTRCSTVMLAIM